METRLRMFAQGMANMLFCGTYANLHGDDSPVYCKTVNEHLPFVEYVAATVAPQHTAGSLEPRGAILTILVMCAAIRHT